MSLGQNVKKGGNNQTILISGLRFQNQAKKQKSYNVKWRPSHRYIHRLLYSGFQSSRPEKKSCH